MANKKMNLSGSGKEILDTLNEYLEIDRPLGVKIALAKGLSLSDNNINFDTNDGKNKWTIPDNIIRDKEYLLYKHLIIEEVKRPLNEDEINNFMLHFIEKGLRIIKEEINNLSSMEDYRINVLK